MRRSLFWALLSAGLCAVLQPLPAAAQAAAPQVAPPTATPLPRGVRVIEIKGTIRSTLADKLRAALADPDHGRFPAGAMILLDSGGGDGLAALEAGRVVREAKAHVFVRGRCSSACVFILAAGVVRGVAPDASVAIHRPRLTTFVKGLGIVDINTATNPRAAMALDLANRRTRDYLSEMGMPDALYAAMLATPIDPVRTLDAGDMAAFRLTGIDPQYLEFRAGEAARKYEVTPDEFERRTSRMPERCLAENSPVREIVLCYRRVLQTGG